MKEHSTRGHALLSASGASRWIACNRSARLEQDYEDSTSSFAQEGTLAHELAELELEHLLLFIGDKEYKKLRAKAEGHELYSSEMPGHVQKYVDFVLECYSTAMAASPTGAEILLEEKVSLEDWVPEGFGTCDANIIADGTLYVNDLKYGKGVKVDATNNAQLRLYALGALAKYDLSYDIQRVRMSIIQPRLDHISSEELSVDDLTAWAETVVKPAAEAAFAGKGTHAAGDHCRWCKAAARCGVLKEYTDEAMKLDLKQSDELDDDEVIEVFEKISTITAYLNSLNKYVLGEAMNGKKWPGYKLVAGKANRAWKDKELLKEKLYELGHTDAEILKTDVKGIGDIEKLVGKKEFPTVLKGCWHKPEGKPTLAPTSDPRKEIIIDKSKDFKNE